MSFPRCLTLAASLGVLVLAVLFWRDLASDPVQNANVGFLIPMLFPAVLGVTVSLLPMRKRTRILLYWLTAVIMSIVGALTLFAGIGIVYVAAVIVFLVAAWMENESGEPTQIHMRGDITTNPRSRPRS